MRTDDPFESQSTAHYEDQTQPVKHSRSRERSETKIILLRSNFAEQDFNKWEIKKQINSLQIRPACMKVVMRLISVLALEYQDTEQDGVPNVCAWVLPNRQGTEVQ